ncbi:uncharacterized protein Z520_09237 [Fonsecaea multimorphosa CBS 102226]|uniref:AB hydrolase-1 domain-containing protein n=1 Tax=Fonsecaea multimorphosa CBS 102226 TaxID=1442371 RepID=A0A0D2JNP0_9EURO|nr:uncharacterized protein Z520_09237 [Fonsecaea multimorphosa CBS 102226]KIX94927.1 hypothetical protein Z520_09237 [Fonsecaea multimorphosa CBS 102226]OAL20578.1 hypothetical protein AYO22_08587 [Fonsecaea multimorphosa]
MPLTAAEILAHPAYDTVDWHLEPSKSGYCEAAKTRHGGPFKLYWEIHGKGEVKLVWIMGLAAYRTAWKRQTKYFGHDRSDQYSCFVFDNRGMGLSDKPSWMYSTSEMARDVIDMLEHVGWLPSSSASPPNHPALSDNTSTSTKTPTSPKRDLHVVGVSMGGMIAQELALLIPQHLASLSLISTAPRIVRTVPFVQNLRQRINMFIPRDIDVQLEEIAHRLFSDEFLALPDTEHPVHNFPTNRDRFAAGELQKRLDHTGFTKKGFMLQAIAAGWHHKSAHQIKTMGDVVGRPRIAVVHGTIDRMIDFHHFEMLKEELCEGHPEGSDGSCAFRVWEGKGHVLVWEVEDEFNRFLEERFDTCTNMAS